jgi:hypothetical protein
MLGFPNPKSKKQEVKEAPKHRSTETPKPETRKREKSRWMESIKHARCTFTVLSTTTTCSTCAGAAKQQQQRQWHRLHVARVAQQSNPSIVMSNISSNAANVSPAASSTIAAEYASSLTVLQISKLRGIVHYLMVC